MNGLFEKLFVLCDRVIIPGLTMMETLYVLFVDILLTLTLNSTVEFLIVEKCESRLRPYVC